MGRIQNAELNRMSPENVNSLQDYKKSLANLSNALKNFKKAEGYNSNPTHKELVAAVEEEIKVIKKLKLGQSDSNVENRNEKTVILKSTTAILNNKSNEDAINKYIEKGKELKVISLAKASSSAKLLRQLGSLMMAIGALAITIGIVVGVAASAPIVAGTVGIGGAVLLTAGMGLFAAGKLKNPTKEKDVGKGIVNNETHSSKAPN